MVFFLFIALKIEEDAYWAALSVALQPPPLCLSERELLCVLPKCGFPVGSSLSTSSAEKICGKANRCL